MSVETLLDGLQLRMLREDAGLKIIDHRLAPATDGLLDQLLQRYLRAAGSDLCKSLTRRDKDVRLDEPELIAVERELHGAKQVADAVGKGGPVLDKEGTVGTEQSSIGLQLLDGKTQLKGVVEQMQHKGRVRRTAAQSCTRRDMLVEEDVNRRKVILLIKQSIGTADQVIIIVPLHLYAAHVEVALGGHPGPHTKFQRILHRDRVEDGLQVVIPVGTSLHDLQSQVDFRVRKGYHIFCSFVILMLILLYFSRLWLQI